MTQEEFRQIVKFDAQGLVPVVVQDAHAKKVRMLAYMNEEALKKTLETGKVHYYSRSRKALWLKGETSGNYQHLKGMSIDCDGDTLLLQIEQENGISCHTGHATCFYRALGAEIVKSQSVGRENTETNDMLGHLYTTILERKQNPKEGSYTNYLFDKGVNKILKKVGEEATEVVIAAKENNKEELTGEIADLMYHLSVLMADKDITWADVEKELSKRA